MSKQNKENKEKPVESPFQGFKVLTENVLTETKSEETEETEEIEEPEETTETKDDISSDEFKKAVKQEKTEETELKDVKSEETEESEKTEESTTFKPFIQHLSDKGLVDFSEEEFEDSEDGFEKVISKTITTKVDEWKKSYPDEVQGLLKFVEMGGDPKDYISYNFGPSWEEYNPETDEDRKTVIKESLKMAGWKEEEATEEIQDYEDTGKLEAKAKIHLERLKAFEKHSKTQLIKEQEERDKQIREKNETEWNNLKKTWFDSKDIKGFPLTDKLKQEVWKHMSEPIDKKTRKTQLQINNEKNSKEAQFLYAYLDYINWDINKLKTQVKTEVSADIKKSLSKFTDSRTKLAKGKTEKQESTEENPFAGFKKAFGHTT